MLLACLAGLAVGPYRLTAGALLAGEPAALAVFWNLRLPRVAAALLVGAALAAAGAAYQASFRNPLVSPDILGASAGASLGAILGIFLSLPVGGIQALAFLGGIATVALVTLIAGAVRAHEPTLVLVLAGVVVGAFAGAAVSLLKVLADPYNQLPAITFWLLGGLSGVTLADAGAVLPAVLAGSLALLLLRWRIDALSLGDEEAAALGVPVARLRLAVIAAATLLTAAAVSLAGVIGWIGLIVPHAARLIAGPSAARLLPLAMLLGGGFLVAIDIAARGLARTEVPLGILTAVIGGPVFLWLLARR